MWEENFSAGHLISVTANVGGFQVTVSRLVFFSKDSILDLQLRRDGFTGTPTNRKELPSTDVETAKSL